jgi:hypothetical protein
MIHFMNDAKQKRPILSGRYFLLQHKLIHIKINT